MYVANSYKFGHDYQFIVRSTTMAATTMILFAVFIAIVHGDSTCKIAPCKCSFSNVEILSKYIDERINATVASRVAELTAATEDRFNATIDERIATAINTTVSAISSESAMWTPVAKTAISPGGLTLENATTFTFQIPDIIPLAAREFMVYAVVKCGTAHQRTGDIIFYVMHHGLRFEKFLYMHSYNQAAWNTNSDNMWFPMPADRLLHVEITVAITGNCSTLFFTTGYR